MGSSHCRTTSGVACHHCLWTSLHSRIASSVACHHRPCKANTVAQRRAWHANIAFGLHRRSDGIGHGMPSSPLGSTHGRTTLGVACHHRLWAAHTVERSWAWHAIIAFGQADTVRRRWAWHAIIPLGRQTRSNDVGNGMPSSPLGSTDGRTTSGVAFHHCPRTSTNVRPSSGVACHHSPWTTQTVGRPRKCLHPTVGRGVLASVVACVTLFEF